LGRCLFGDPRSGLLGLSAHAAQMHASPNPSGDGDQDGDTCDGERTALHFKEVLPCHCPAPGPVLAKARMVTSSTRRRGATRYRSVVSMFPATQSMPCARRRWVSLPCAE